MSSSTQHTRPADDDARVKVWRDKGASPAQAVALVLVRDMGLSQSDASKVYGNTKGAFGVLYNQGRRAVGLGDEIASGQGGNGGSTTKALSSVQLDPFAAMRQLIETQLGQIDAAVTQLTTAQATTAAAAKAVGGKDWTAAQAAAMDKAIADAQAAVVAAQAAKAAFETDPKPAADAAREKAQAAAKAAADAAAAQLPQLTTAADAYRQQLQALPVVPAPADTDAAKKPAPATA